MGTRYESLTKFVRQEGPAEAVLLISNTNPFTEQLSEVIQDFVLELCADFQHSYACKHVNSGDLLILAKSSKDAVKFKLSFYHPFCECLTLSAATDV